MKLNLLLTFLMISFIGMAQHSKFITYNIRYANPGDNANTWDKRKGKVVDLISHYEPDIFGIQEGLSTQVNYLNNQLTNFSYIGVGRDDGKEKGEYCAIFYNHEQYIPIQQNTFWLSNTPDKISVGWDASMERICTYGLFKNRLTGKNIWIFNTHFDHRGKVARAESASLIVDKIKSVLQDSPAPVVLMGDLNAIESEKPIITIRDYINDAKDLTTFPTYGPVGTFNGFNTDMIMDKRIDYVFLKGFKVVKKMVHIDDRRANNLFPSDHLPVYVEVDWE